MQEQSPTMNQVSFPYTNQADPEWIRAAFNCGFRGSILTRQNCMSVQTQTLLPLPRWLMKDETRRLGRGEYACPELDLYAKNPI